MLKMRSFTDVFLGHWPEFTDQLFYKTLLDYAKQKASRVLTRWFFQLFNDGGNERTYLLKQTWKS